MDDADLDTREWSLDVPSLRAGSESGAGTPCFDALKDVQRHMLGDPVLRQQLRLAMGEAGMGRRISRFYDDESLVFLFAKLGPGADALELAEDRLLGKGGHAVEEAQGDPPTSQEEPAPQQKKSWIAIEMKPTGKAVDGLRYKLTLADGSTREGKLGGDGTARHDGIPEGECRLEFPDLDKDAWSKV